MAVSGRRTSQRMTHSWSHMIEKAIRIEVEPRESLHNGGNQYAGRSRKLAPGRPVRYLQLDETPERTTGLLRAKGRPRISPGPIDAWFRGQMGYILGVDPLRR